MPLAAGARLGPYQIQALVGRGGMGEVYRARDPRLERDVAIKVLRSGLGDDPDVRQRFDEEARLAARMDHPRICAVYDVGHEGSIDYLVMEFLEGESLAARMARGPIPLPEVLGYAIEIASALAYAHAHHLVHGDIKPGNIFLTRAGVKVVDFGLAKLRHFDRAPSQDVALMETRRMEPAVDPVIQCTPEYTPPERLQGRDMDHRGDIFAFGAVVYELATRRRPFEGSTPGALVAAVMRSDPPPMVGHGTATPALEWLVRRCLRPDADSRWQSMSDVEAVLKWMASGGAAQAGATARAPAAVASSAARYGIATAVLLLGIAAIALYGWRPAPRADATPPSIAIAVPPPDGGRFTLTEGSANSAQLAVSPDGRLLAFVATGADGMSQIWVRPLDSIVARRVEGTTNGIYPFWSSDSRSIGFFADRQLRRVEIGGGPSRLVADAPNGRGGTWNADNIILFAPSSSSALMRVAADGTGLAPATTLAPEHGELSHRWPQFLPDGRRFVFFSRNAQQEKEGVYLASLDGGASVPIAETNFAGIFAPPGRLLYVIDGALVARNFDLDQRRLTGDPVAIVQDVGGSSNFYGAFSVSATGVLAYATSGLAAEIDWVARDGSKLATAVPAGAYVDFQLSADARYLAVAEIESRSDHPDIHVIDVLRNGADSRLTWTRETDASPVWSPDGTRLVFRSNPTRVHDLYLTRPASPGSSELFLKTDTAKYPTQWSREGFVVYHSDSESTGWDIWAAPVSAGAQPHPLVKTRDAEVQGHISPNGRWLAYTWFTSPDQSEVYAKALDGTRQEEISVNGGSDPHWSADGSELFYVARDGMLMSVRVQSSGDLNPATPKPLFRIPGMRVAPPYASKYDVEPAGHRFLVHTPIGDPQLLPLRVLVNWQAHPAQR